MKLLLCRNCADVFSLRFEEKSCSCGKTFGKYTDELNAVYSGDDALPLGFNNRSFVAAINNQPETGWGKNFEAFVIQKECNTFIKQQDDEKTVS